MAAELPKPKKTYEVANYVGGDFVEGHLKGRPLIHGVVEAVINSLNWQATLVHISLNGVELEIIDNGCGLIGKGTDANKAGILRPGDSVGKLQNGKKTRGKHGTGVKDVYVHCRQVWLDSPPKDEPDVVYSLSFSYQEYFASLKPNAPPLVYNVLSLSQQTWPYLKDFRTGLRLKALLKSKLQGGPEALAKALSARLLSKYRELGIVLVNGARLPERKLIGSTKPYDEPHDKLGKIVAEFYNVHPDDRVRYQDALRIGGRVVAEAPFSALGEALEPDVAKLIPDIFTGSEICGSVIVEFLEEYSNPDRKSFAPEIEIDGKIQKLSSDPRLMALIMWLRSKDAEISNALKIKIAKKSGSEEDDKVVANLRDMMNSAAGGNARKKNDLPPPPDDPDGPKGGEKSAIVLTADSDEYEHGEPITIRMRIRKDLQSGYSRKDVRFFHSGSLCEQIKETEEGLTMVAGKFRGKGRVSAEIIGSPHDNSVTFQIVDERIFKFKSPYKIAKLGEPITIKCMNTDKAKAPFTWSLEGVGTLEGSGDSSCFTSTHEGEAIITVTDSSRPDKIARCTVQVVRQEEEDPNILKLEDEKGRIIHFSYRFQNIDPEQSSKQVKATRPIQMVIGGDGSIEDPYRMFIYQKAFGYEEAKRNDRLDHFLLHAICEEFPYFMHFESRQRDEDRDAIRSEEWPELRERFSAEGNKTFARIMTKKK